jgi:hypothetical protein
LTSDPFLDQTLLYVKDGKDYATKLTLSKIDEFVEMMKLHCDIDSVSEESDHVV